MLYLRAMFYDNIIIGHDVRKSCRKIDEFIFIYIAFYELKINNGLEITIRM